MTSCLACADKNRVARRRAYRRTKGLVHINDIAQAFEEALDEVHGGGNGRRVLVQLKAKLLSL